MPTRNISLTDHFDRLIDSAVASGEFQNASEVVREGLRLLERQQQAYEAKLKALRDAVQLGIDELERGEGIEVPLDELSDFIRHIDEDAEQILKAKP